ncbi:helix-turn-helix transcriptional regulator [Streptomyces rubrogriseus]|uniref:helix-turn-helix transcriptional regulator n=1 Tax=Streptomyces rubrogriseus TaxID=194673 RepID=UPI000D599CA5|nr:LuxR family transcriptional regulator [Streptomyces rubrogriseus]
MALYERERQLTELRRKFSRVLTGKRQVVIVNGPVGSGKTELLRAFAERTAGDRVHLGAVASRAEQHMPTAALRQLVRAAALPGTVTERVDELLRALAACPAPDSHTAHPDAIYLLHSVCATLLDALEEDRRPLLITVDDVHYADMYSLHCLALLLRRLQRVPAFLILTEAPRVSTAARLFQAEFPVEFISRVNLGPLTQKGVAALLREHLGPTQAREAAPRWHGVSGGNPLMLRALLDDMRGGDGDRSGETREPVAGMAYSHALLSCLHRSEQTVLDAARALAVLGPDTDVHMVAKLIGISTETAQRAWGALEQTGVVTKGGFRHPEARLAVLGDVPRDQLDELHWLAGRLLYANGADAATIAEQVVAVEADEPAAVPLLHEGAKQALSEGKVSDALAFLRRAYQLDAQEDQMTTTTSLLARVEWRLDPETALRRLPALRRAAKDGHLAFEDCLNPVGLLLWGGEPGAALALWHATVRRTKPSRQALANPMLALRIFLSGLYPTESAAFETAGTETTDEAPGPLMEDCLRMCQLLREPPSEQAAVSAEKCLHDHPLRESSIGLVVLALMVLLVNGRLAPARRWAKELREEADAQGATSWAAFLRGMEASVTLQLGDPASAAQYARIALTSLSERGWGVAVGLPLSVLIRAYTSLDRLREAGACLQISVPEAMFQTPVGLMYRHARGLYHHASGRYEAALDDFRAVGDLTRQWGVRMPGLNTWQTDAAWSCLALGRVPAATRYARAQLEQCAPGDRRARAAALRLLAAVEDDPAAAIARLNEAVLLLERGEETLDLAHALADLGHTLRRADQNVAAGAALERAGKLAARGNVRRLGTSRAPVAPASAPGTEPVPVLTERQPAAPGLLSRAEQRVAVLAAHGMSNRQISRKLYVTVSTVEQHLTRIYRKLNVTRRVDLALQPLVIDQMGAGEPAEVQGLQTHAS